jgi:hypothetical protein
MTVELIKLGFAVLVVREELAFKRKLLAGLLRL